jgi:hypothetical protein
MKNLYDPQVFTEITERINQLTPDTTPQWGKMDAAQMMAHCKSILDVSNGKPLENTPFMVKLIKGYIKKMVVGPKPYPKNSKTHPQYLQKDPKNFDEEKKNLFDALAKMKKMEGEKTNHTLFGVLTSEEKGWAQYKHIDHHLTQFGV